MGLRHGPGLRRRAAPSGRRIETNMTFSDEPGIYIPGEFGVRLEDDVHVTGDGARWLTPQSPSLEHPFG
jgi:Xaa-Pro dipeptidase